MNLHQIVSGAIGTVNPFINATIKLFSGESTDRFGHPVPSYTEEQVTGQLQPLGWKDLQQLDGLNITGVQKKFYVNGFYSATSRITQNGGDLLIIDGRTWLIKTVLEWWPDWCSVAIQEQTDT
ncbi:TPA: hypothetical protein ONC52_001999 [Enterobacter asburiae]|uniref:hypothetical protein n=1 Tax=Enterobacter roggenkampii TaxID=1812935 RepID=UPI000BA8BD48|nr:hypothetical protein [Enterobacter roggenkampii]PAO09839.1 hypothetical protein CIW60_12800 [Enterobacter roggenkampii]HCR2010177.1 hypothetical protein [Enterobacter asburiae]HCR2223658.1 hypothetical protein [Enterobacter asburiae]